MNARLSRNLRYPIVLALTGLPVLLPILDVSAAPIPESLAAPIQENLATAYPGSTNLGIANPGIANPGIANPGIANPDIGIPLISPSEALLSVPLPPPGPRLFAITPERRALLNTIRYAEGTWANGDDLGYRIMFGGGLMASLERHPEQVNRSSRYASAAAGAYQFMPSTWRMVTQALGLEQFGPQVQDQGALFLIQRRGALSLADQGLFTPHLAHRLAPEWASIPTLAGRSYYGQPVKRYDQLKRFYEDNLAQLRVSTLPAEPPPPVCEPADTLRCRLEALDRVGPRTLGS